MSRAAEAASGPIPPERLAGSMLPGAELVASGIEDLRRDRLSPEALLVCVGEPRLRMAGLELPAIPPLARSPELELYAALRRDAPVEAHSRYNALIRRLVSFERALERLGAAGLARRNRGGCDHP